MHVATQQVVVCLWWFDPPKIETAFTDDLQTIAPTSHLDNLFIQKSFLNRILTYLSFFKMIIFKVIFLNKILCSFLVCTRTHIIVLIT
jgi:hypothetical protein